MRRLWIPLAVTAMACASDGVRGPGAEQGETDVGARAHPGSFSILTYNVAGLPQGLSSANPERYVPQISPLLNGYDLVVVQEDFWYHAELAAEATHPYRSAPWSDRPSLLDIGDGLNRFSRFPFENHDRTGWGDCNGMTDCASDCLASKGWSFARHTVTSGVEIDVYNLHMEAGRCDRDEEIRSNSVDGLVAAIRERSANRAVVVAGDFNLHVGRPTDREVYRRLLDGARLTDACWSLSCGSTSIDRVLVRSGETVYLEATAWWRPGEFVDAEDGSHLSDHRPTAVTIEYTPR